VKLLFFEPRFSAGALLAMFDLAIGFQAHPILRCRLERDSSASADFVVR
jgi:hypothetical protein